MRILLLLKISFMTVVVLSECSVFISTSVILVPRNLMVTSSRQDVPSQRSLPESSEKKFGLPSCVLNNPIVTLDLTSINHCVQTEIAKLSGVDNHSKYTGIVHFVLLTALVMWLLMVGCKLEIYAHAVLSI